MTATLPEAQLLGDQLRTLADLTNPVQVPVPMAERRPDDCTYRVATGGASSFAAGSLAGAATANWGDVPVVLRDKPGPALKRTGKEREGG